MQNHNAFLMFFESMLFTYFICNPFHYLGEVLSDNLRREVAEEAGIVIENVQYFQSQAWALPQTTLMLACTATAVEGSEKVGFTFFNVPIFYAYLMKMCS